MENNNYEAKRKYLLQQREEYRRLSDEAEHKANEAHVNNNSAEFVKYTLLNLKYLGKCFEIWETIRQLDDEQEMGV